MARLRWRGAALALAVASTGFVAAQEAAAVVQPGALGVIRLRPADADLHGRRGDGIDLEEQSGPPTIGGWIRMDAYPEWRFQAPAGRYVLDLEYAATDACDGSTWDVEVAGRKIAGATASTGDWIAWKRMNLGEVDLKAGVQTLLIRPTAKPKLAVMNLAAVRLVPLASRAAVEEADRLQDQKVELLAKDVTFHGPAGLIEGKEIESIGGWTDAATKLAWSTDIPRDGEYDAVFEYSVPDWADGATVLVAAGDQEARHVVAATDGYDDYRRRRFGTLSLKAGPTTLIVEVLEKPKGGGVMNLRRVILQPRMPE